MYTLLGYTREISITESISMFPLAPITLNVKLQQLQLDIYSADLDRIRHEILMNPQSGQSLDQRAPCVKRHLYQPVYNRVFSIIETLYVLPKAAESIESNFLPVAFSIGPMQNWNNITQEEIISWNEEVEKLQRVQT